MKLIISPVRSASVEIVEENIKHEIGKGLLIYIGITSFDEGLSDVEIQEKIQKIVSKVQNLQLFSDNENKIKNSLIKENLEVLLVSNFTLCGKNNKGNKIDFKESASYDFAKQVYKDIIKFFKTENVKIKTGEFGAKMQVESINFGPLNYVLEI